MGDTGDLINEVETAKLPQRLINRGWYVDNDGWFNRALMDCEIPEAFDFKSPNSPMSIDGKRMHVFCAEVSVCTDFDDYLAHRECVKQAKKLADVSKEREEFQKEQNDEITKVEQFVGTLRDPDTLGSAEYRQIYELIKEAESLSVVRAILVQFQMDAKSVEIMLESFIDTI